MKNLKSLLLVFAFTVCLTSCYTIEHTVGSGAKGDNVEEKKQWFALWGLVPLNDVDSKAMAGNADNYNIKSQQSFIDGVISALTGIVTISVRTIEVTK